MKNTVKKLFCLALCAVLLLPMGAQIAQCRAIDPGDAILIYVRGSSNIYKFDDDGTKTALYDDGDYIVNVVTKAMPLLPAARATGNYTAYANKVLELMHPAYDTFRPSLTDGSVPENTRPDWYWTRETVKDELSRQTYAEYWIDERLSPFAQAADLNEFIETVKELSGKQKILLYARCLGPVAMLTYLYEYQRPKDYADVQALMLSFSTHAGMALTDAAFTGNGCVPENGLRTWLAYTAGDAVDGEVPDRAANIIRQLVNGIGGSLGIRLTVKELNRLYENLKDCLFQPLVKDYYALNLSYAACVTERFDDMMDYLYPTAEDQATYAYAIGELTRYHETVYPAINDMLQDLIDQDKNVMIMADYGGQQYPVTEDSELLGDFQVGTREQSLGATVTKIGQTLDADYVIRQNRKGLGRYISPDQKLDASTCAFPDNTYFIANLNHSWPADYANLEEVLLRREDVRVTADPEYPQFLWYDSETGKLVPLTDALRPKEEEAPTGIRAFFAKIKAFFVSLAERFRAFFAGK